MDRKLGWMALAVVFTLAPSLAFAQLQTGSILVKAVDDQGATVPGATVTVASPVLPAPLTGVTDSTGVYRYPSLAVGVYSVKVALQGFQTVTHANVVVVQSQTASVEIAMKLGGLAEEVTVKGEAPVVDSRRVSVAVNLDASLLDTTPGGKDIWSILETKVPGIVFDTPDVGGNQSGLQRGFTARGTSGATARPPLAMNSNARTLTPITSSVVAIPRMIVVPAVLCTK
jgi:hypothetical protein